MVSHLNPSTVNLYSLTFSVPAVFRSPMRLALRGGHSTSPAVSPSVGGGGGGAGAVLAAILAIVGIITQMDMEEDEWDDEAKIEQVVNYESYT